MQPGNDAPNYVKGDFALIPNLQALKGKKPQTQAVFIWLCHYANAVGESWPSVKTLAQDSGCSERSVRNSFIELEEAGILVRIERRVEAARNKTNLYQIKLVSKEGAGGAGTWVQEVQAVGAGGAGRTITNRTITNKNNIYVIWNEIQPKGGKNKTVRPSIPIMKKCKKITPEIEKEMDKIFKNYTPAEVVAAISCYRDEICSRNGGSGEYAEHRFSLWEFLKQENGLRKFMQDVSKERVESAEEKLQSMTNEQN